MPWYPNRWSILTILHAWRVIHQGGYKTSGDLHGVGSSVVNALSSWLEVEITVMVQYKQRFEMVENLEENWYSNLRLGTKVTFMPDATIFLRL